MESASAKSDDYLDYREHHCVVCETRLRSGYLCEACERHGLDSLQYAELFWEEA